MINEYFLVEQKLVYMLKEIELLFVDSFYQEDLNNSTTGTQRTSTKKSLNEKRVHQIV